MTHFDELITAYADLLNTVKSTSSFFRSTVDAYEMRDKLLHDLDASTEFREILPPKLKGFSSAVSSVARSVSDCLLRALGKSTSADLVDIHTRNIDAQYKSFVEIEHEFYDQYVAFCSDQKFREVLEDSKKLNDFIERASEIYMNMFSLTSQEASALLNSLLKKSANGQLNPPEFFKEVEDYLFKLHAVPEQTLDEHFEKTEDLKSRLDETYPKTLKKRLCR